METFPFLTVKIKKEAQIQVYPGPAPDNDPRQITLQENSVIALSLRKEEGCIAIMSGTDTGFIPISVAAIHILNQEMPSERDLLTAQGTVGDGLPDEVRETLERMLENKTNN